MEVCTTMQVSFTYLVPYKYPQNLYRLDPTLWRGCRCVHEYNGK